MPQPRSVDELLAVPDPAWPAVAELVGAGGVEVRVLGADPGRSRRVLYRLQVTAGTTLGALAANTGGLLADHGWLRVLGGGGEGLPDLAVANELPDPAADLPGPARLVVAYDVLGGSFAIATDPLHGVPGQLSYWAPDTLSWEPLGMDHASFIQWSLSGGLDGFYEDWRWPGWQQEVAAAGPGEGIATYPLMSTAEGLDLSRAGRRVVPFGDLLALHADVARRRGAHADQILLLDRVED